MTARHQGPLETDRILISCLKRCLQTAPRTSFRQVVIDVLPINLCSSSLQQRIKSKDTADPTSQKFVHKPRLGFFREINIARLKNPV